jgi:hypothetical protein
MIHEHTVVLAKLYKRKHSLPTVLCVPVEDYAVDGLLLVFLLSAWLCNALPVKLGKGWFLVGSLT